MSEVKSQYAVQLVGPNELVLNPSKPIPTPGPHQILVKSEAVGLCFSDMKLLAQFDGHVRKSDVVSGIDPSVLQNLPSYVPGGQPTVPGHEVVCRVVEVGSDVTHYRIGERWIVQADYRTLKTAGSNGAFGYNFEGGLQEYVLLDERIIGDPNDESAYMIRVPDDRGASQVALVEPWACVENSYVTAERTSVLPGGRAVVVVEEGRSAGKLPAGLSAKTISLSEVDQLGDESLDDVIYFGSKAETLEALNDKLAKGAIINVVLGGESIGRPVNIGVGRIHYGGTRWIGTTGNDATESYRMIPGTGEIRPGDKVLVVGAGGPMGQMHVIRNVCAEMPGVVVVATDVAQHRLDALKIKVNAVGKSVEGSTALAPTQMFDYVALMAPIPALVEDAIQRSKMGGIVNVFAGIPAPVKHPISLDKLIRNRVFVFGTSGSEPRDMRTVLSKVVGDQLDTNTSVAAVSGMAGATDGLRAVEERTMDGKIIVYPMLSDVPLIPLEKLADVYPTVAVKLRNGQWTAEAETEFLLVARH